jgi:hypothetical protein
MDAMSSFTGFCWLFIYTLAVWAGIIYLAYLFVEVIGGIL